ncbi:MAG: sigma-E factor negative regulatory protein RseC [Bacillota bacterium]|jgi:sigma-E factor negative regulatory protein RseC|nr:sigma-E factor negative regulatory protein RseC [Bacillota bacterium]
MQQIGVVVAAQGERAKVKVCRATACSHCGRCPEGERHTLSLLESPKEIVVDAFNEAGAREGQTVELAAQDGSVLLAAFLAYMVPLIAFFVGAFLGNWLAPRLGLVSAQLGSIILGLAFLAGTYGLLRLKNQALGQSRRFLPTIVRVLH